MPELVEDFGTKNATVELDKERIDLAQKLVTVAQADVKAAAAALDESKAILAKYQSELDRWDSEVKRLRVETEKGVVDPQILLESTNQLKSTAAARDAARATIMKVDGRASVRNGRPRQVQGQRRGCSRRLRGSRERGEAAQGLGGLSPLERPLRRRDRGPQRQHRRFCPARHGRSHGHAARS